MNDVSAEPSFPLNSKVALALNHPLRLELLGKLQGRTASARELASEVSVPLARVDYHLGRLREVECVVLADDRPDGGGLEHFYTAKPGVLIDSPEWADAPPGARDRVTSAALSVFLDRLTGASSAGTVERNGTSCTTATFLLDQMGWEMANRVIRGTLIQLRQLHEQSEARAYVSESDLIPTVIGLAMFEAARPAAEDTGDAEAQ